MNSGFIDPTLVSAVEVSVTGKCFAKVGFDSVWFAPFFGASWEKVFDTTMILNNPEGLPYWRSPIVAGMGINRANDDEVMIVVAATVSVFTQMVFYNYMGSAEGGFSPATLVHWNTDVSNNAANDVMRVTNGGGTWVVTWSATNGAHTASFSQDGVTPLQQLLISPPPIPSTPIHTRSAVSPQTALVMDVSHVAITNDNGLTWSEISYPSSPFDDSLLAEAAYTNPAGNVIALRTFNGTYGSVDGGSSWAQWPVTSASLQLAYWNLNDDTDFLYTEVGSVKCTGDFGNTMIDLTSNLADVVGTPNFIIGGLRTY